LREREYARLDANDHAYLDYTGGGLYADSQLRAHHELLHREVFGNPHSEHPTSRAATDLVDATRAAILRFVRASPDEYAVVFTANASAALKLVGEAYPFTAAHRLLLTADNHNSVNGIRSFARARGAGVDYVPLQTPSLRVASRDVVAALDSDGGTSPGLFAFPAQSNYSGVRHPLGWIGVAQANGWDVLLDASASIPTNRLDLSRWHPDFVAVSWYKALGYPTGIGSLIVRHDALARLRRPWFAGGTIGVVSVAEPRHTLAPGVTGFEDGTIDYLGIPAIEIGLRHLESVGIETIGGRVRHLTEMMLDGLTGLRHANGAPRVHVYGPLDGQDRGGTIAFNLLAPDGRIEDFRAVVAHAGNRRVSLRGGCFCNPGSSEAARGITAAEMRAMFALEGPATGAELRRIFGGKALGAVRASVGIASNERDVERLLEVIETFPPGR